MHIEADGTHVVVLQGQGFDDEGRVRHGILGSSKNLKRLVVAA